MSTETAQRGHFERVATVQPTTYEVTAYPHEDYYRPAWTLTVEYRGRSGWAVLRGKLRFARSGGADYEPTPSERTDDWIDRHSFTLDEALALAREEAPRLKVNGKSLDDALAELAATP